MLCTSLAFYDQAATGWQANPSGGERCARRRPAGRPARVLADPPGEHTRAGARCSWQHNTARTCICRIQLVVATVLLIMEVVVLQRRGRLPVPREGRLAFWEAVRAGVPVPDAAAAGGVLRTAETWFRQAGGVKGN